MSVAKFLAAQARKPSGAFGKLLFARLLNRVNRAENALTLESLRLEPGDRALEVGFGGGDLLAQMMPALRKGHVAGIDFSPEMVAFCEHRFRDAIRAGRMELKCASVDSIPYEAGRFTKACSVNSVYFWPSLPDGLAELARALKPGGMLSIAIGDKASMARFPWSRHGFQLYDPHDLAEAFGSAGLGDVDVIQRSARWGDVVCVVGRRPA